MKKQTVVLFTVIFLVIIGAVFAQRVILQKYDPNSTSILGRVPFLFNYGAPTPTLLPTPSDMSITVDFGQGNKITERAFGQTAYQVLVEVAKVKNWQVEAKDYKYGKMVEKIGDKSASKDYFWLYKVNGRAGQIASDRFVVYPGDNIEWVYVKN